MKRVMVPLAVIAALTAGVSGYLLFGATPATPPATGPAIVPYEAQSQERIDKSPRHGEWIEIKVPGREKPMKTWIVYPERADKAPVVMVIMEIFGMTPWIRATTDQLAADGFIAIAPDFLSGKGPNGGDVSADQARGVISSVRQPEVTTDLNAVREYALKIPAANGKIASIGFCWGGGMSFGYAVDQPALDAAVVCYGTPPADDAIAKIKAPIAGFYGGNDARITATVPATTEKMKAAGKTYEPHVYDGAGHGFMRQHAPGDSAANQKAASEAWPLVIKFLKEKTK